MLQGGLKAVIWIDNIQVLIMAIGLVTLVIKGTIDAGGMDHVWQKYKEGHRTNIAE